MYVIPIIIDSICKTSFAPELLPLYPNLHPNCSRKSRRTPYAPNALEMLHQAHTNPATLAKK